MGKNMNFSGQPIFNQLLNFIDKNEIKQIAKKHEAERYVKKFTTYHSIRETILGLLANAHKLSHWGLSYLVRRSTLSEANVRRISRVFEDLYMSVYRKHANFLADSRLKDEEIVHCYGENKKKEHRARRIAYWDSANERLFEFVTNNFDLSVEKIAIIYKKRWQIELLFKQLKQNFPLKYFL